MLILCDKIAQNSIKYYDFISRMISRLADIVSVTTRYREMFLQEGRVMDALAKLYLHMLSFLQRIRAVICKRCESSTMTADMRNTSSVES